MNRFRRVMLVTPPYHCGMVESAGVWMPLGLAYLAGSLKANGYEPIVYDAMSRFDDIVAIGRELERQHPDVVATTAYTATVNAAIDVLRLAKALLPGVTTVIGGVHPTHMAGEVLDDSAVDFVVRGEGEAALPELLDVPSGWRTTLPRWPACPSDRTRGRSSTRPARPLTCDLDSLPIAWECVDWPLYHYRTKPGSRLAITSWSRGCTNGVQLLLAAAPVAGHLARTRRRVHRRRAEVPQGALRSRHRRGRRRAPHLRSRAVGAHPATGWSQEDLGIELLGETRADDVVRDDGLVGDYRDAGLPAHVRGRRVAAAGPAGLDAQGTAHRGVAPRAAACSTTPASSPRRRSSSATPTTRRRPSRRRCVSPTSSSPTLRSSSRSRRGPTRTCIARWRTGSRSTTTASTT